jgi:hypothetical protein
MKKPAFEILISQAGLGEELDYLRIFIKANKCVGF